MIARIRILEAASRLFGELGYQGTTTRRIALEAGVSEVTLFRQFGSKDALLREALGEVTSTHIEIDTLPANPTDPERELFEWSAAYLHRLRATRPIIRRSMGELADRPTLIPRTAAMPAKASRVLKAYLKKASEKQMLPSGFDVTTAATILAGVLFADALSRDLLPEGFPEPASRAHEVYVRFVLRSGNSVPPTRGKTTARRQEKLAQRGSSGGAKRERVGATGRVAVETRAKTAATVPKERRRSPASGGSVEGQITFDRRRSPPVRGAAKLSQTTRGTRD